MRYGKEYCSTHYITLSRLTAIVLDDIRYQARCAEQYQSEYVAALTSAQAQKTVKEMGERKALADRDARRMAQLDNITKKLLEQNALGIISDSQFVSLSKEYELERREIESRQADYDEYAQTLKSATENAEQFSDLVRAYTNLDHLDAKILNRLIEKIMVHQRQRSSDGTWIQKIEIYYRFVGRIQTGTTPEESLTA